MKKWPGFRALITMLLLSITGAATAGPLPPITATPTDDHLPGKFVWAELVTSNIETAQDFYAALFGWTFEAVPGEAWPYAIARAGDQPVAGFIQVGNEAASRMGGRWIGFISVDDVAAASAYFADQDGEVVIPKTTLDGRGDQALLVDPDGVPVGVINAKDGDPADDLVAPGEWIWSIYQSPAALHAAAFYQNLAGYEVVEDDRFFALPHYLLATHDYARASLVQTPADNDRLRPGWIHFIRVTDLDATLEKASALGATVVVSPSQEIGAGLLAVIQDPNGVPLGLLEWGEHIGGEAAQ